MSSIIRWRKGDTLRTAGMVYPKGVVWLLMASNNTPTAVQEKAESESILEGLESDVAAIKNSREAG
jgi:hypothetical protein